MKILITGGAGFIGSHVVEHHLNRGDNVVAVDDLSTGSRANLEEFQGNPRFRFVHADIMNWDGLAGAVHVADRVYHLAAVVGMFRVLREPVRVTEVNVCATELLLSTIAAAPRHPQVVIASSSSVYSHTHSRDLREDDELVYLPKQGGLTGYALSKLTNEIQAMAYREEHGLQVTIPRLFNAVGPRQTGNYGFVLPRFIKQALAGDPLTVFGATRLPRSYCSPAPRKPRGSRSTSGTNARHVSSILPNSSSHGRKAPRPSNSSPSTGPTGRNLIKSPSAIRWRSGCAR